jgi:hypothetical protein
MVDVPAKSRFRQVRPCVVPVGPSRRLSNLNACRRFAKEGFEHLILGAVAILQQLSPGGAHVSPLVLVVELP